MWMDEAKYLEDNYEREFESKVIDVNDKFVVLEKTLFYPNSGGQPNDIGTLTDSKGNKYNVVFVGKFNDHISHEVDKTGLKKGDIVKGKIDWQRRYKFMRYHSASHLLTGVIFNKTNAIITGNNISIDKTRIDFNLENFDREIFADVEKEANEWIKKGAKINKKIITKDEAMKIEGLVKLAKGLHESITQVRTVEIEGLDIQACGGTHLNEISEIKGIKITKLENKGKNNRRLYFVLDD